MHIYTSILLIIILILGLNSQVSASQDNDPAYYLKISNQQAGISQQKATAIAQQHRKGRVLSVDPANGTYRVKILSDQGSVHIITISASDGSVISSR